ncbi:unnamed protein product [Amoebophrya sp. A120]|nr:unnamed protein product [Amoebophrya sp. A120]|eukprot:GSA120T00013579001.1
MAPGPGHGNGGRESESDEIDNENKVRINSHGSIRGHAAARDSQEDESEELQQEDEEMPQQQDSEEDLGHEEGLQQEGEDERESEEELEDEEELGQVVFTKEEDTLLAKRYVETNLGSYEEAVRDADQSVLLYKLLKSLLKCLWLEWSMTAALIITVGCSLCRKCKQHQAQLERAARLRIEDQCIPVPRPKAKSGPGKMKSAKAKAAPATGIRQQGNAGEGEWADCTKPVFKNGESASMNRIHQSGGQKQHTGGQGHRIAAGEEIDQAPVNGDADLDANAIQPSMKELCKEYAKNRGHGGRAQLQNTFTNLFFIVRYRLPENIFAGLLELCKTTGGSVYASGGFNDYLWVALKQGILEKKQRLAGRIGYCCLSADEKDGCISVRVSFIASGEMPKKVDMHLAALPVANKSPHTVYGVLRQILQLVGLDYGDNCCLQFDGARELGGTCAMTLDFANVGKETAALARDAALPKNHQYAFDDGIDALVAGNERAQREELAAGLHEEKRGVSGGKVLDLLDALCSENAELKQEVLAVAPLPSGAKKTNLLKMLLKDYENQIFVLLCGAHDASASLKKAWLAAENFTLPGARAGECPSLDTICRVMNSFYYSLQSSHKLKTELSAFVATTQDAAVRSTGSLHAIHSRWNFHRVVLTFLVQHHAALTEFVFLQIKKLGHASYFGEGPNIAIIQRALGVVPLEPPPPKAKAAGAPSKAKAAAVGPSKGKGQGKGAATNGGRVAPSKQAAAETWCERASLLISWPTILMAAATADLCTTVDASIFKPFQCLGQEPKFGELETICCQAQLNLVATLESIDAQLDALRLDEAEREVAAIKKARQENRAEMAEKLKNLRKRLGVKIEAAKAQSSAVPMLQRVFRMNTETAMGGIIFPQESKLRDLAWQNKSAVAMSCVRGKLNCFVENFCDGIETLMAKRTNWAQVGRMFCAKLGTEIDPKYEDWKEDIRECQVQCKIRGSPIEALVFLHKKDTRQLDLGRPAFRLLNACALAEFSTAQNERDLKQLYEQKQKNAGTVKMVGRHSLDQILKHEQAGTEAEFAAACASLYLSNRCRAPFQREKNAHERSDKGAKRGPQDGDERFATKVGLNAADVRAAARAAAPEPVKKKAHAGGGVGADASKLVLNEANDDLKNSVFEGREEEIMPAEYLKHETPAATATFSKKQVSLLEHVTAQGKKKNGTGAGGSSSSSSASSSLAASKQAGGRGVGSAGSSSRVAAGAGHAMKETLLGESSAAGPTGSLKMSLDHGFMSSTVSSRLKQANSSKPSSSVSSLGKAGSAATSSSKVLQPPAPSKKPAESTLQPAASHAGRPVAAKGKTSGGPSSSSTARSSANVKEDFFKMSNTLSAGGRGAEVAAAGHVTGGPTGGATAGGGSKKRARVVRNVQVDGNKIRRVEESESEEGDRDADGKKFG